MKKVMCMLLALCLLLMLAACGQKPEEVSLYDRGLEVIDLMLEAMESEEYLNLLSASENLRELIDQAAAGEYSQPEAVYVLSFPGEGLGSYLAEEAGQIPESLTEVVNHRMITALVTQINAMGGMETLAASSMCTVGKTFVSTEYTEDVIYLYTFAGGCPVAVVFTGGEDDTVSAAANVILYDGFPCGSAEEIRAFFGEGDMEVTLLPGA